MQTEEHGSTLSGGSKGLLLFRGRMNLVPRENESHCERRYRAGQPLLEGHTETQHWTAVLIWLCLEHGGSSSSSKNSGKRMVSSPSHPHRQNHRPASVGWRGSVGRHAVAQRACLEPSGCLVGRRKTRHKLVRPGGRQQGDAKGKHCTGHRQERMDVLAEVWKVVAEGRAYRPVQ